MCFVTRQLLDLDQPLDLFGRCVLAPMAANDLTISVKAENVSDATVVQTMYTRVFNGAGALECSDAFDPSVTNPSLCYAEFLPTGVETRALDTTTAVSWLSSVALAEQSE